MHGYKYTHHDSPPTLSQQLGKPHVFHSPPSWSFCLPPSRWCRLPNRWSSTWWLQNTSSMRVDLADLVPTCQAGNTCTPKLQFERRDFARNTSSFTRVDLISWDAYALWLLSLFRWRRYLRYWKGYVSPNLRKCLLKAWGPQTKSWSLLTTWKRRCPVFDRSPSKIPIFPRTDCYRLSYYGHPLLHSPSITRSSSLLRRTKTRMLLDGSINPSKILQETETRWAFKTFKSTSVLDRSLSSVTSSS